MQPLELVEQHWSPGPPRASAGRLRCAWPETDGEVIVYGRDAGRGAEVVAAIEAEGGRARFVASDLTDIGEVRRLAEEAGEVDRIINLASWYGMIGNAGTVGYNITEEAVRSRCGPPPRVGSLCDHRQRRRPDG